MCAYVSVQLTTNANCDDISITKRHNDNGKRKKNAIPVSIEIEVSIERNFKEDSCPFI